MNNNNSINKIRNKIKNLEGSKGWITWGLGRNSGINRQINELKAKLNNLEKARTTPAPGAAPAPAAARGAKKRPNASFFNRPYSGKSRANQYERERKALVDSDAPTAFTGEGTGTKRPRANARASVGEYNNRVKWGKMGGSRKKTTKKTTKRKTTKKTTRKPKVHKGPRGGKYIIRKGKKVYV